MTDPGVSRDWAVQIAVAPADRDRVYRFRYDGYAAEHGRFPSPREAPGRVLRDAADEKATLFFVEFEKRVAATLRLRFGPFPPGLIGPLADKWIPASDEKGVALADAIVVSRMFRKAHLLESMVEAVCDACADFGVRYLFCHLHPETARLVEGLDFVRSGSPFLDPVYGTRVLLVKRLAAALDDRRSWQSLFETATGIDPGGKGLLVEPGS